MAKTKYAGAASIARKSVHARKRRSTVSRRPGSIREEKKAPAVIANSAFALTLLPKAWADLSSTTAAVEDPAQVILYSDMVRAYNHGAELVGIEKISFEKNNSTIAGISELLALFKKNICPKGFDVNIDEHYNKRTKKLHFHFTVYQATQFPAYWHFFEIKNVVSMLMKTNKKLHDLFIVFLSSFIHYCRIPTWYFGPMGDAQYILSDYATELREIVNKESTDEVKNSLERTGYTIEDMKKRLSDIEGSMKEYATGKAQEYMLKITKAKPLKPHYLLRSLKRYPGQHKLVKFMRNACELMKEKVGMSDFCYHYADGEDTEGLCFDEQVTIIWDWSDHISATQGRTIDDCANGLGVFSPTLCARFMPSGTHGLDMEGFVKSLSWPKKLTALQIQFQEISERFTDYNQQRVLL